MPTIPVFPLGSVLLPGMPLALRVFEPRYLKMLGEVLDASEPEFGVVLIERGSEVGGGDHRFDRGTMARIIEINAPEGFIGLLGQGGRRFVVDRWLDDDPYPRAEVSVLEPFEVSEEQAGHIDVLDVRVRHALAAAHDANWDYALWPADTVLSDDYQTRLWQLTGILPVGPLDLQGAHGCVDAEQLLDTLARLLADVEETLGFADS